MMNVLILYANKENVVQFLPELTSFFEKKSYHFHLFLIHPPIHLDETTQAQIRVLVENESIDYVLCLGGDGTVLTVAQFLAPYHIPILPVNFGHLGFIAETTTQENMLNIFEEIEDGSIYKEQRVLLEVTQQQEKSSQSWLALNEAYLGSNQDFRVGNFMITANDTTISKCHATGFLLATPTGSTACNLSAGGPIAYPSLDALILTAVVPHKLTYRPLVLPGDFTVTMRIADDFPQNLIVDGKHVASIQKTDSVVIKKSQHTLTLLYSSQRNYFDSLKEKLNWLV